MQAQVENNGELAQLQWQQCSLCLSLSLSLSLPNIHLWKRAFLLHPSLAEFSLLAEFLLNIIPIWFRNRSHIDAQEYAMLISTQTFPQSLGNKRERRIRGRRSTPVKTVTSIHFRSIALVAFSTSGVMDFTAAMKAPQRLSSYSAHGSWSNEKTSSLLNLCFFSSCSFHICFFPSQPFSWSFQHHRWQRESAAAWVTHTAQQHECYFSKSRHHILYGLGNAIAKGLSQLAKANPIYYLWRDINSRECDPLQLSDPLKPSILSSIRDGNLCGRWDLQWHDLC